MKRYIRVRSGNFTRFCAYLLCSALIFSSLTLPARSIAMQSSTVQSRPRIPVKNITGSAKYHTRPAQPPYVPEPPDSTQCSPRDLDCKRRNEKRPNQQRPTQTTAFPSGNLMYYPLPAPVRLLDTRPGASPNACSQPNAPIAGQSTFTQQGRAFCGIPTKAVAITGNITPVLSGGGYLTLWPSGTAQPTIATTNYEVNEVNNNVFTVGLGVGEDYNFKIGSHEKVMLEG